MNKLAIITGASTGIGFELASVAAQEGFDIIVVADETLIHAAAADFRVHGTNVTSVESDLSTFKGVDELLLHLGDRRIDILCANAGTGYGGAFLTLTPEEWKHSVDTNITGTVYLVQQILHKMVKQNEGRILVTGSIVGYIPGSFNAIYNATKAFIDNFTDALRDELKDVENVTLTTLMPGATDTPFFARADMLDTEIGKNQNKADPADVARAGWDAMLSGQDRIVPGFINKMQVAVAGIVPPAILAGMHRKLAEPHKAE